MNCGKGAGQFKVIPRTVRIFDNPESAKLGTRLDGTCREAGTQRDGHHRGDQRESDDVH